MARNSPNQLKKYNQHTMFRNLIDYDLEMEEKVLGVFLMEPLAYASVISILREECFYGERSKEVYKAIKYCYEEGYGIDYLVVQNYFYQKKILQISGENIAYITTCFMSGVVTSAHLVTWCLLLRQLAANRLMFQFKNSGSLKGDVFEEAVEMEERIREIMQVKLTDDWVHISQVALKLDKHMREVKEHGVMGVTTSIDQLDGMNGAFRNTNLIVIGARPSVGKSAFMGRIATYAAFKGKTVGIISLEMEDKDIFARNIAADADVDFWRIDRNNFHQEEEQRDKVYDAMRKLSKLPIYFSDTAQVGLTDIRAKAERIKTRHGVDLLIIDYLQLIEPENVNNRNREQEVSKICRGLKLLAMNMKIPIIILAQLNRQAEEKVNKKPELHHLRESGSIEQDADVVMFLHRDWQSGIKEDEHGNSTEYQADLLIRKWRNGATGDIKLGFHGPTMKFTEIPLGAISGSATVSKPPDKPNAGFQNARLPPLPADDDMPF